MQFLTGTIKLSKSDVSEEMIHGALSIWGQISDIEPPFFTYFNTGCLMIISQLGVRSLFGKKKMKVVIKTKIVLFEDVIAFISILQCIVNG